MAADGTLTVDEVQDQAGNFRDQACQYYNASPKNYWVCSPYAGYVVSP